MTEKVGLVKSWSFLDKGQLEDATEEPEPSIILGYLSDEIPTQTDVDPYVTKIGGFAVCTHLYYDTTSKLDFDGI